MHAERSRGTKDILCKKKGENRVGKNQMPPSLLRQQNCNSTQNSFFCLNGRQRTLKQDTKAFFIFDSVIGSREYFRSTQSRRKKVLCFPFSYHTVLSLLLIYLLSVHVHSSFVSVNCWLWCVDTIYPSPHKGNVKEKGRETSSIHCKTSGGYTAGSVGGLSLWTDKNGLLFDSDKS